MPIFDNELLDSSANRDPNPQLPGVPKSYLGSPTVRDVDVSLPLGLPTGGNPSGGRFTGLSIAQLSQLGLATRDTRTFGGPMMMVPRKELLDNQRYGTYVRGVDLENIYSLNQPWYKQMGNGVAKFFTRGIGTFVQSFATIPNTIAAVKNGSFSELSGKDGYESDIDIALKNMEESFPNYVSRWEREHPYRSMVPFMRGSANFWGDKVISNLGFTAGAIGGALVQDAAVGFVTGGIGEIPLIAAQIGRASLYLNKLFTSANRLDKVLDSARALGKSDKFISSVTDLGRAAAATKLTNGFRYGLTIYGSARTEAAIEARDGYRQVRDELINQYKSENGGMEPQGAALDEIESYATDAMNVRFGANMALLTLSNTLQFGTFLKSFTNASRGVPGTFTRSLDDAGRIGLAEGSLDVFERKAVTGLGAKAWDAVKPTLKNVLTEGVYEEGGQFATEKGVYDYYTRKYKNLKDPKNKENWDTVNEVFFSVNKGLAEQFGSSEGIQNMIIGGISAIIAGGVMGRAQKAMGQPTKNERLNSAISVLNRYGLTGIMQDQYSNTLNSAGIAQEMQEAADSGNIFRYKNLKHDQFFGFVHSRIPSGLHDVTIEQLNMLKDLDKAEFEKTFGMDFNESSKKTVNEYVDSLIEKANSIKDMYDSVSFTFKNPFVSHINPATEEQVRENFNFDTYNDWKTNLVYYASVAPDVRDRLNNIQNSLSAINPLLSNDTISSLTKRDSLKELAETYEQQAKTLGDTITEFTTPADKRGTRDKIKTLRTLSERINLALNKSDLDIKTFENLLNFEMSGREGIDKKIIPSEKIAEIYNLGADINSLEQLRDDASESFDNLASEEGFNKFFNQAEQMAEEQEEEAEKEEPTPAEEKPLEFVNKAGATEIPQIEREYQLDTKKLAKVKKIADDRYEVVSPLGESTFYGNKEDADQAAEDMNENIQDLQKVKVLAINEDGTIKVEDLAGNIQNIKPTQMAGYERIQTAQEKLIEKKEELTRQQDEIEKNSGGVTTIDSSQEFGEREPAKREVSVLFTGGITESETYNDPTKSAPHVIRSRRFLNNVKNNKNRANVKAILVTPNQEAGLGLTGLAALSYKVDTTKMTEAELKEFNATIRKPDTGFIAQVFVVQKGNKLFFADDAGNPMNEVGTQVDLNKVVFQTMPTPELNDSKGNPRYRAGQEAEAKAYSEAWAKYREQLMGAPATAFTIYDFRISRGIPIVNDVPLLDENGSPVRNAEGKPILTFERNHVGEVLVPEDKVGNKGLILISITGEIIHNGLPVNVLRGTPVLQYGDTLQVLNNRAFNKAEAKTIFRLLSELSKGFALNSNLEESYVNFLQNVLHWKQGKSPSKNQVYINPDTMELRIAGKDIPLSEVADREAEIMEELQKTFSNVNNKTIFSDYAFTEYFIDQNDQIASREWPSYNSYLLSASYPDGSKRSVKETPLFTSVSKPTASIPYSYMQKYAVLEGLELDVQYTAPAQQAAAQGIPTVDGHVLDGKTRGVYSLRKEFGDVEFTASVEPSGSVTVELVDSQLTKDTLARIAKNKDLINNQIVPQLKELGIYDPVRDVEKTDEEIAGDYVSLVAATSLGQKLKEKPAAAPAAPTQTTPSAFEEAENKLKEIWNNIGNNRGRSALEDGWAESFGYISEALSVGGQNYQAHGMGKSGFPAALRDLFDLFKKGIDPSRGGGQLYTAPLSISQEDKAAAAAIGTAGGTAYTDGAFVLIAKRGIAGIRSVDDIGGILVNSGLTDINPEILTELRKAFPNLVIESYQNTKALVEQLNTKAGQPTQAPTAAPVSDARADVQRIVDAFDPETNFEDPVDSWGIYTKNDEDELIKPEIYVIIKEEPYTKEDLLETEDPENPAVEKVLNEIDRLQKLLDTELAGLQTPVSDARADIERRRQEELQQLDNLKDGDEVTYFKEDGGFTKGIVTDFKNGEFNLSYTNENEDLKSPGSGGIYNTTFVKAAINAKYNEELAALEGAKKGFQGYKGGFENAGKGTPQGDGKDKAMRKVADSAIVELASNKDSSSKTSLEEVGLPKEGDKIIMLARNGSLSGKALRVETKEQIRQAHLDGAEFIVGDMPGVDSQFIDYLQEIGAKFTVYHTGDKSRITIAALEGAKPAETYKGVQVIDSPSITTATGEPGAAQYNRAENKILVNRELLKKKFDEKAWTKPRKQKDGSSATALPENAFPTYDSWEKFVIEHEFQHSLLSYEDSGANTVGEYEDIINRRALGEEAKPAQPYSNKGTTGPSTDFRVIAKGEKKEDKMDDIDLAEFRKWHAANVPGIPFEILENIIRRNPDITAWGVFENGVAKFYRSATRGTEYHEIFEGIWKGFLSPGERQDLLNEFKGQSGTFKDRASGRNIEYAAATDKEAKERIADDFADFRLGKLPARSLKELMLRFFRSIMNFFKNFNAKPTLKQQLFEAIDMGKFKESVLPDTVKNEAAEYKEIEGLSEQQAQKFVEDMTARVAGLVFLKAKKFLYSPQKLTSKQIFGEVEQMYLREGETPGWDGVNKRTKLGDARWNALVQRTKEKLRAMGVNFDVEDRLSLNNEETNKNDYAPEPFTVDVKKSSSFDVKFTLATLFKAKAMDQSNSLTLEMPEAQIDPEVLGYKLLNFSTAFATLLERLSNTSGVNNTMDKLIELAANDSDYVRMFTRLGGKKDKSVPYSNFKAEDWRFFISFMQTFTRQRPDAMVQRVAGGQTFTTSANIQTAARQQVDTWVTNMKVLARTDKGAVFYNSKTETYKASVDKIKEMTIESPKKMIEFLNEIGVTFDMDTYKKLKTYGGDKSQKNQFANAVKDIRAFLQKANDLVSISGQTLGITTQLNTLGRLYVNANNPNQDITYFGIERKRMQAYIDNNTSSVFENEFNESATLDELLEKRPELKDIFSTNSQILKKGGLYFDKEGNRIREIKVMTIQGVDDSDAADSKSISKLGLGEGLSLQINQNLNGNYYILIPADSSTEWMMNVGNQVSYQEFVDGKAWNKIYKIYKGYLMDDIALARDFKNRGKLNNVKARAKELRFFNDILRPKTLEKLNSMIADKSVSMDEITKYVNENQELINQDVAAFIDGMATKTMNLLRSNSQISYVESGILWESLDNGFARENKIDKNKPIIEDVAKQILLFRTANYTISNIEYHKMLFGDPLQFSTEDGKFDETKRIKSFLSPRKTTFDMAEFDNFLNDNMNEVAGIMLQPGDPGYHNHKAYTRTVTLVDPKIASVLANTIPAYVGIKEADAGSWLMDNTFREIKLKNGQWSDEAENFHQWQMAYTRKKLAQKGKYTYRSPELKAYDEKLTSTPSPKYTLEVLKPIVSGVKYNSNNINLVLDKFSQMPIYYSMVEGKSLEKFYIQMLEQGYGYAIVESGRKVGAEGLHNIYNPNGTFNEEAFNNFVDVPWKAYGIQVENIYDEGKEQTRGSQSTKLISIDLFANGQVFAATGQRAEYIKELYKRNVRDLDRMHVNAYNRLLKKLGIVDNGQGFTLEDKQALSELLVYEMFRRELSENAKDTVRLNEEDEFNVPFEASPSYVQIRNIIYSMIEKAILSPKMGGKPLVQAPVTMWENAEKGRSLVQKTEDGWKKISREEYEALDKSKKKNVRMTSDTLKFYTKDQPYMEVLLPHWFKDKLAAKKFKTEEALLDYINKSPDGAKILRGIGFRIPTQSLSSIDSFKVVGFLPQYMGDTVIVPTELVTKAGSDFDIDKLNTYLRNVYVDATGNLRLVKYKGSEEATKEFFTKVYEDTIQTEIDRIERFEEFREKLYEVLFKMEGLQDYSSESITAVLDEQEIDFFRDHKNLFKEIVKQAADANVDASEYIAQQVENLADKKTKLTKKILNDKLKTEFVEDMYKRSLENEYYDSFEELLTLPENRQRLLSPVGDGGLKEIALEIEDLTNDREADVKNKILDPNYMATLRHAFLTAKRWVGIGAVNITNQSLSQKVIVYMDPERIKDVPAFDQKFLGDGTILLPHNKVTINGKEYMSMSGVMDANTDADKKLYISDGLSGYITSFVDVANDPYIMKIIRSDKAVGTFMLMQRIGVPIRTAALFMNQPIIKQYLELVEGTGSRGLFRAANMNNIRNRFPVKEKDKETVEVADTIDTEALAENIREFANKGKLSTLKKNAEQQLIFDQFLRLAMMAKYNFSFTQAINFDTTKFKSSDALGRKIMKSDIAKETNIFTSPEEVLNNSHIGLQKRILEMSDDAVGSIFVLDQDRFRSITDKILDQYKRKEYMSEDDYARTANKIRTSFLDYIIQTKTGLNAAIKPLLIDANTSVATRLAEAKTLYANELPILRQLEVRFNRDNGIHTVMLMANVKDAASENMYIGMMRELRNNPKTNQLYKDLITLSILQGTYQTGVSIKNIIPIEDYSAIVAPVIGGLQVTEDMDAFADGMFQRNNWDDNNVFYPVREVFFKTTAQQPTFSDIAGEEVYEYYSPVFPNNEALKIKSSDRKVLYLDENYDNEAINSGDYVKIRRIVANKNGGELVDVLKGVGVSGKAYAFMKKAGNPILTQVLGYQKVTYPDGTPVTIGVKNYKDEIENKYVYKLINLYGEGAFGSEYYTDFRPSVVDNNTLRIKNEIPNADIIAALSQNIKVDDIVQQSPAPKSDVKVDTPATTLKVEYTPENITSLKPNEVFVFGSNTEGRHGAGAALTAKQKFGAIQGQAEGLQGQSYAIITKDLAKGKRSIPLYGMDGDSIAEKVRDFVEFANSNPQLKFYVTKLGSELAGYSIEEIKNIFDSVNKLYITQDIENYIPNNVILPREYEVRTVPATPAAAPVIDSDTRINIYAGTGENADLSNFANRPFKLGDDVTYPTVEHAFQLEKLQYSNAYTDDQIQAIVRDMNTKSAAQVKAFGKTIKGLDVKRWNEDASEKMKEFIKLSFQANPKALERLLATGNATLTHTQDTTKWGKEFPRLLMEVREELRPTVAPKSDVNSLIDRSTIRRKLTNGTYSFYPTEKAAEDDKGVVITRENVDQAIEAEEKFGEMIHTTKGKLITGLPSTAIDIKLDSSSSIEFEDAKDLQDFINNEEENDLERSTAAKEYNRLAGLEGVEFTPAPIAGFEESRFNNIEKEIGNIITIDEASLRLLSVEETGYENVKFLRLQSRSGLVVPATITYNEETGESEIESNPSAEDLGLDEQDYNTDDFKC